jgi:hypothetical protein
VGKTGAIFDKDAAEREIEAEKAGADIWWLGRDFTRARAN